MGAFDEFPEFAGALGFVLAIVVAPIGVFVWFVTMLLGSATYTLLQRGLESIGFDTNPAANPFAWPLVGLLVVWFVGPIVLGAVSGLFTYRWIRDRVVRRWRSR